MDNNIRRILETYEEIGRRKKIFSEAPSSSNSLLGGKTIKIPRDGAHAGQSGWQSFNAWDIKADIGDPVYSVADGTVITMNDYGPNVIKRNGKKLFGAGFTVKGDGTQPDVYYTHLKNVQVQKGQKIKKGQLLGFVMDFPGSSYDHLHIAVEPGSHIKNLIEPDGKIKKVSLDVLKNLKDVQNTGSESISDFFKNFSGKGISSINFKELPFVKFFSDFFTKNESFENNENNILETFNKINETKNEFFEGLEMTKLSTTSYSNLKFDKDGTQNDEVNKSLLDDLNKAAKKAGLVATITTAKTGHGKYTKGGKNISRHMSGTAVDIAILDGMGSGGATNSSNGKEEFRKLGNKLAKALEEMGYSRNKEVGQTKAVLWQTNTGGNHFNHLHVSNKTGVPSDLEISDIETTGEPDPSDTSSDTKSFFDSLFGGKTDEKGKEDGIMKNLINTILKQLGINESFVDELGPDVKFEGKSAIIKNYRKLRMYSPISGEIDNSAVSGSCKEKIVIEFYLRNRKFYLEYCGIENVSVRDGDIIRKNQLIGDTKSNIRINLYDSSGSRVNLSNYADEEPKKKVETTKKTNLTKDKDEFKTKSPIMSGIVMAPFNLLGKVGNFIKTTPFKSITKEHKINEDIERIKKLL
jgi:hypothetical protein